MHGSGGYHDDDLVLGKAYDQRLVRRLLPYLRPYRGKVALSVALVAGSTAAFLVQPRLIGMAIDEGLRARDPDRLLAIALAFCGAEVLSFAFAYAQSYLLQSIGQHILRDLRMQLFSHLQTLSVEFFDRNPVGRLVTRVTNDVAALAELFSSGFIVVIGDLFLIGGLAVAMLLLDANLALRVFAVMPFLIAATIVFRNRVRHTYREVRRRLARLNAFLQEHVAGARVVQLFAQEARMAARFGEVNESHYAATRDSVFYHALFTPVVTVISATAIGLLLWSGGVAVAEQAIQIGVLVAFINYAMTLFEPIRDLSEKYNIFQGAMASAERIFRILDTRPTVVDPAGVAGGREEGVARVEGDGAPLRGAGVLARPVRGEIRFENVWFAYEGERWVLEDVSWSARPGERVAIVGATGAGKSTTLALLQRFYDPQRGRILLDGVDIRSIPQRELRRRIGTVQQDVFLFSGTIDGNLRLGVDGVSRDALVAAARATHADGFISRLEGGYDAPVRERGATLSVGQRQLLAFARTLVCDPPVLVLDEATASVDVETERALQDAVWKVMSGRTALVIAHRLSTIEGMDRILVMHHGRLREEGSHGELLARGGIYAKLYRLQFAE
ncbi:MAG: ABC transporter ATP-binding protein [Planctomycetes bacterium]|nr:ABC transporter ATP-binding protein [Planctomycetota bacterium]